MELFHFNIRKNDKTLSTKFNDIIILNVKIKKKFIIINKIVNYQ